MVVTEVVVVMVVVEVVILGEVEDFFQSHLELGMGRIRFQGIMINSFCLFFGLEFVNLNHTPNLCYKRQAIRDVGKFKEVLRDTA